MIDPFVLLTPILLLGVMALIRFVGCNWVFGIVPTEYVGDQVQELAAKDGDEYVQLKWAAGGSVAATKFTVHTANQQGGTYSPVLDVTPVASPEQKAFIGSLVNGTTYWFKIEAFYSDGSVSGLDNAEEVSGTPHVSEFLTVTTPGLVRNNFDGTVGMAILVKEEEIIVTQIGRWTVAGNTATHDMRIVAPGTGKTIGVATVAPDNAGAFSWAKVLDPVTLLPAPATLQPNGLYYILTQEFAGGDEFLNIPTVVEPIGEPTDDNIAQVLSAVYTNSGAPTVFNLSGAYDTIYGPVNFKY